MTTITTETAKTAWPALAEIALDVRPFYVYFHDLAELERWLRFHWRDLPTLEHAMKILRGTLPPLGWVAVADGVPVALVFLYTTGTTLGMLHYLSYNPDPSKKLAALALDAVVEAALEKADSMGLVGVLAWTESGHVARRARRHGFNSQTETILYRGLPAPGTAERQTQ